MINIQILNTLTSMRLKPHKPRWKFRIIQICFILTMIQSVSLQLLNNFDVFTHFGGYIFVGAVKEYGVLFEVL
jgi:hypothetical protein